MLVQRCGWPCTKEVICYFCMYERMIRLTRCCPVGSMVLETTEASSEALCLCMLQQATGYSGYHGAEFASVDGDGEPGNKAHGEQGDWDGEARSAHADKRPVGAADASEAPASKRQRAKDSSPAR